MAISVYQLKPYFQKRLEPVLAWAHRQGFTANDVTLGALLLSVATGLLVGVGYATFDEPERYWVLLAYPPVLFIRMALNALDGMLARRFVQTSVKGELLNEAGDVASDLVLYLPWLWMGTFETGQLQLVMGFLFLLALCLNEGAGILARAATGLRRYEGPMGKSDRALFFGLLGLIIGLVPAAMALVPYAFGLATFFALWGAANRLVAASRTPVAPGNHRHDPEASNPLGVASLEATAGGSSETTTPSPFATISPPPMPPKNGGASDTFEAESTSAEAAGGPWETGRADNSATKPFTVSG